MTTLTAIISEGRYDNVAARDESIKLLVREVVVNADDVRELIRDGYRPRSNKEELERRRRTVVVRHERPATIEGVVTPCARVL